MSSRPISRKSATYTRRRITRRTSSLDPGETADAVGNVEIVATRLSLQLDADRKRPCGFASGFERFGKLVKQAVPFFSTRRRRFRRALEPLDGLRPLAAIAENPA